MSRSDLKDLGDHLDEGQTGLVVVAAADVSAKVEAALEQAEKITSKQLQASDEEIEKDVAEATSESSD